MSHLGRRVSDLLDGQLTAAETEAAWAHVHTCHQCRDDVEREGWVKTRLSALGWDDGDGGCAPDRLKGMLLGMPPGDCLLGGPAGGDDLVNRRRERHGLGGIGGIGGKVGIAALGGGAAGAAFVGMLALGPAPAQIPVPERNQQPVSHLNPTAPGPRVPARFDGR